MSSPTFYLFPKLPYELRLLIWEATCFNGNKKTRHGLNYIDVSDSFDCRLAVESNTSACIMDTGLWGACTESRAVVRRKFRKRGLLLADITVCKNQARMLRAPSYIRTRLIISGRDLFCFRISDWCNKLLRPPGFDFYLDRHEGISQAKVCNLAFELDVVDWDKDAWVLPAIRKALRQAHLEAWEKWGEKFRLSIIDKNVHRYRGDSTVNVTYADSDDEYTIVSWQNLCYCDQTAVGTGAHALRKYIRPSIYENSVDFYRGMEETVKVLVRRDREVSCPLERRAIRPEEEEEDEDKRNRQLESLPVRSFMSKSVARLWYAPYRK